MSTKRLYVGNLPFDATQEAVRAAFEAHGTVHDVSLVTDRDTGRPRGFGFVEM
ncbi:MAG: RNA-binding protein, partial [Candidatus Krumholzibacteria bacterium]|nr:RNA-binding protein [Candidatus Krumholzibacteria bacterium]